MRATGGNHANIGTLPGMSGTIKLLAAQLLLVALLVAALVILGSGAASADAGDAAATRGYEHHLVLECQHALRVQEGDDFRLYVHRRHSYNNGPTMRVDWYTDPGTADESDYSPLHAERQASNGYQSRTGVMGRTFHTTEDNIREQNEHFTVRFENTVRDGDDGSCKIWIMDDDWH